MRLRRREQRSCLIFVPRLLFPWVTSVVHVCQDTLNLILARYALNGTFLGFEKLGRQFDFCGLVAGEEVTVLVMNFRVL